MTDSKAGKTNMTFVLDRGVFNTTSAFERFNSTAVYLRVGFFDEGKVHYMKSQNKLKNGL